MSDKTKKPSKTRRSYFQPMDDPAHQARAARNSILARDTKRADAVLRTFSWQQTDEASEEAPVRKTITDTP